MFDNYNVIFVTLDCCRYDTFEMANLPFLKSIGEFRKAITYGSYTLPAHISFFAGYLPNAMEFPRYDYYSRTKKQLWRLSGARKKTPDKVEIMLEGNNIFEGYKNKGYFCLGVGGVRWFRNSTLTNQFDEFLYWGCDDYHDVFTKRRYDDFALMYSDVILEKLKNKEKWFLFINSQETHVPYDIGDGIETEVDDILVRVKEIWGGKDKNTNEKYIKNDEFKILHMAQIKALEEVDKRLENLVKLLPGPKILVVCGDHGEAFGEDDMYGHGFPAPIVMEVPLLYSIFND